MIITYFIFIFRRMILTTSLTLLTLIIASHEQSIQITDLLTNPGLLTLETGLCFLKNGRIKIYHEIDLDQYAPLLGNIFRIINGLNSLAKSQDITDLLMDKYKNVKQSYHNLLPITKSKRALDFLGTGIKSITGNLDANDLAEIYQEINKIKEKNNNLVTENNKQIKINRSLENRINRLINSFNSQQNAIAKEITFAREISLNNKIVNINYTLVTQAFKISYNLERIEKHLQSIFQTIQLSKINIVARDFLELEELKFIEEILTKMNITLDSLEQIYEFINIQAFYKNQKLYFVIIIPKVKAESFEKFLVEALPIHERTLKLPSSTIIKNSNRTFFVTGGCQDIGTTTLCDHNRLVDVSQDGCFSKLLYGHSGRCIFTDTDDNGNIKRITDNHIILKNVSTVTMSNDCQISNRTLTGTYLIHFSNCSVHINGQTFSNRDYYRKSPWLIVPLNGLEIIQQQLETNMTISKLHELHLITRKQLTYLENTGNIRSGTGIALSSICLIAVIAICIIWVIRRKTTITKNILDINIIPEKHSTEAQSIPKAQPQQKSSTKPSFESGRFELQEGAVNTEPHRLSIPIAKSPDAADRPHSHRSHQPEAATRHLVSSMHPAGNFTNRGNATQQFVRIDRSAE